MRRNGTDKPTAASKLRRAAEAMPSRQSVQLVRDALAIVVLLILGGFLMAAALALYCAVSGP